MIPVFPVSGAIRWRGIRGVSSVKHLNRYHSGMTAHGGTDVGNVEVRTRKNHEHQLFIKSTDKDLHFLCLGHWFLR